MSDEEQKNVLHSEIMEEINERLLDSLAKLPFSAEDSSYFGNELQQYIANHDLMHLYNFAKRIEDIWKDKLKLLPNSEYGQNDWEETMRGYYDAVSERLQNPQANGQEAGENK